MLSKLNIAWDYFLHHPDKTQVIIQVHLLNPLFKKIESGVLFIIDIIRKLVLIFVKE